MGRAVKAKKKVGAGAKPTGSDTASLPSRPRWPSRLKLAAASGLITSAIALGTYAGVAVSDYCFSQIRSATFMLLSGWELGRMVETDRMLPEASGEYRTEKKPEVGGFRVLKPDRESEAASLESLLKTKEERFFRGLGPEGQYVFVIDKADQEARVYRVSFELVDSSSVSTGKVAGDKERSGDYKTPEGIFSVVSQEDSSGWTHAGRRGAYGNHFSRLSAGSWDRYGNYAAEARSSIGIHGTDEPEYIGQRRSEGCIRLPNGKNDEYVANGVLKKGTAVVVLGDAAQGSENSGGEGL